MPETDDRARFFALDPEVGRCPYAVFEGIREEQGLYFEESMGVYVAARHADILEILRDGETFASTEHAGPQLGAAMRSFADVLTPRENSDLIEPFELANIDGERHRRLRGLVNGAFTRSAVRRWEPVIRTVCRELIAGFREQREVEFVHSYARPVAILTVARILGLPEEGLAMFEKWFASLFAFIQEAHITREVVDRYVETGRQVTSYFENQLRALREVPDDRLLSQLVHTSRDGDSLSDRDLASVCLGMLAGTSETTAGVLTSAAIRLSEDDALARRLRGEPERFVPGFVDEMLRLHSPIQGIFRTTTRPVAVGGTDLPEGAHIYLIYGSGNRDGDVYPDPDTLDLERSGSPTHLAMGGGAHRCLGAHLGLAQVRIALEELLAAFDVIELARPVDDLPFQPRLINPGIAELPLMLSRNPALVP